MRIQSEFIKIFFSLWFSFSGITLFIIYFFKKFTLSSSFLLCLFIFYGVAAVLLLLICKFYNKPFSNIASYYPSDDLLSSSLAYLVLFYALGKIFGLQFIVPEEIKSQPALSLSGFYKAWLFFEHSYTYGLFIACGQLLAAVFLVFRKTRTGGALLYFIIMSNIVVMDFEYGVESMQQLSVLLLLMAGYLLACDYKKLVSFFFSTGIGNVRIPSNPGGKKTGYILSVLFFIAGLINEIIFYFNIKNGN